MQFPRVMVTGHRPQGLPAGSADWVERELERLAVKLRDRHGMRVGISGLALGSDTWWGFATVFAWQELWAFLPFPQQADRWAPADVARWRELRQRAAHEIVVADEYSVGALHARNDAMLDNADLVIAVYDRKQTTGGTASAVSKALSRGLPILHVDPVAKVTIMQPDWANGRAR